MASNRQLKKIAKARRSYGRTAEGLKMEMRELKSLRVLSRPGALRWWTTMHHRRMKMFKWYTGLGKRKEYDFYYWVPLTNQPETVLEWKRRNAAKKLKTLK